MFESTRAQNSGISLEERRCLSGSVNLRYHVANIGIVNACFSGSIHDRNIGPCLERES